MPTLFVEIPDHANTVRRASMLSVVVRVLEQLGLDKDYIQFNDGYDNKAQPGTAVGPSNDVKFGSEQRISVEMDDQRDSFNLVDRGLGYKFQIPIFHDSQYGVRITPAHARHNVTAKISARFPSRGLANEWINSMHRRTAMYGDIFEVEATFHYIVPDAALTIIKMMYLLGCKKVQPTLTMDEYIAKYSHENLTNTTTDTGSSTAWTVRNTMGRIVVIMDGLGEIREDKDEGTGTYTAEISYTYQIDWPEGVKIDYPCIVNNTVIPESLWQVREQPGTVNIESYERQDMVYAQDKLTTHYERVFLPVILPPVGYPQLQRRHGTEARIEVLIAFLEFGNDLPEGTPPKDLQASTDKWQFNLKDMGNVTLPDELLAYIKDSYSKYPDGRDSMVKFVLYDFTMPLRRRIEIDQDFNVWVVNTEIDLTKEYRIAMFLEPDMSKLNAEARLAIKRNIPWLLSYIKDFFPEYTKGWPWLFPGTLYPDNVAGGGLFPVFTGGTPQFSVPSGPGSSNAAPPYWGDKSHQPSSNWNGGNNSNNSGIVTPHPFWPTFRPWINPGSDGTGKDNVPVWPTDYIDWWVEDDLVLEDPVIKPDGSVEVVYNPEHPGWDWMLEELSKDAKDAVTTAAISGVTVIALRR